jgi:hypothetical protein
MAPTICLSLVWIKTVPSTLASAGRLTRQQLSRLVGSTG